ncbi:MAG: hypothetical protein ACYTKD_29055 [Planctomycetota bacterium]
MNLDAPILYAAMGLNEPLALARIGNGNDLDYSEEGRGTALHMAARLNLVATVRALLEAGADPSPVLRLDDIRMTPLDCAGSRLVRRIIESHGGVSEGPVEGPAEGRTYPRYDIHAELAKASLLDGLGQRLGEATCLAPEERAVADVSLSYRVFRRGSMWETYEVSNGLEAAGAFVKLGAEAGRRALVSLSHVLGGDDQGRVDELEAVEALFEPAPTLLEAMDEFQKTRPDTEAKVRAFIMGNPEPFEA